MPERELVIKAKNGDAQAFCALYSEYKDRLYRYAVYRLGNADDAQDAVSDCVLCAYEQIKSLKNPDAFNSWIFRILYCSCCAMINEQIKQRSADPLESHYELADKSSGSHIEQSELRFALGMLTDEERDIVLLSVLGGLKSREIAKISGLTSGSVRSKLSRSLSKMRKSME